jgi:hypothetical protein
MEGLSLADRVVHEPEQIIRHEPILEKEILQEPALEVKREHHIQPIIHEREHRIQPIVKTEATTEQPIIVQDKSVMHEPIVEPAALPAGLEPVERAVPEGVLHRPIMEKEVILEHPVQVKHERHIQPIIHEKEHHIQPIVKTEVTAEQRMVETESEVLLPPIVEPTVLVDRAAAPMAAPAVAPVLPAAQPAVTATTTLPPTAGLDTELAPEPVVLPRSAGVVPLTGLGTAETGMLDSEERLPSAAVPPPLAGEREVYNEGLGTGVGSSAGGTATIGQKIKGALKEVQGTITRNPAKKEEGKRLMHGIDPATGASTTGTGRTGL